jgi:tRNA threonylcarbamoyladenosine biosynthesis protein TsaB
MLLALDTSTRLAGIALYSGERGLICECSWHSANQHTTELLPRVARMLAQAGVAAADLQAVAVALGPGSFTGVRVALAAAKGLSLANGLGLLGVPTLDVVAYPHSYQPLPVVALVQAGRSRVCWAVYGHGPAGWGAQTPFALVTIAALAEATPGPALFAGELSPADRATLAEKLGDRARLLPPALALRRSGHLAEIAWARYIAGQQDDPATLTPIYL